MNSTCLCGKVVLHYHIKRHQKTCKEFLVHERTSELEIKIRDQEEELQKQKEELSLLRRNDTIEKVEELRNQLKEKDEQIKKQQNKIDEKDEQIRKLENALIQKPNSNSTSNYNSNSTSNYNHCNVIVVNAWGNETFDHITEEDKVRALRNYTTAIPNIVEQIHFGKEKKNRNVKLSNKRAREVLVHKELDNGEVKQVHEDLNEVLADMIANGKYVLDPVAERLNMTKYKKFREDLRESERIKGKLYAEQKNAVKRKLMDNASDV